MVLGAQEFFVVNAFAQPGKIEDKFVIVDEGIAHGGAAPLGVAPTIVGSRAACDGVLRARKAR